MIGRKIFMRMNCQIDTSAKEFFFKFFCEESFTLKLVEAEVKNFITLSLNDL